MENMTMRGRVSTKTTLVLICIVVTFFYISPVQYLEEQNVSRYEEPHLPNTKTKMNKYVGDQKVKKSSIYDQKFKKSSNLLELELSSRKDLLRKVCADLGPTANQLNVDWDTHREDNKQYGYGNVRFLYLDKTKNARVCKHYKAGYSTWKTTARKLKKQKRKVKSKSWIITVRHPLARLLSAWKDKYLGGLPLSMFDEAWRRETNTVETRMHRWARYWMLALVSAGKIKAPASLREAIKNKKGIFAAADNATLPEGSTIKSPELVDMNDYLEVSFTFEEFLRHVIWTYENGVPNIHWTPTVVQCDVCNLKYDYITHLENSTEEVPYVLNKLGFTVKEFGAAHQSHQTIENEVVAIAKQNSYVDYYKAVSKDVIDRIMDLYDVDFNLFGYSKELV